MKSWQPASRLPVRLLASLLLAGSLAARVPAAAAPPPSRGYERTFRYPYPVAPVIETLAQAEWRERTLATVEPEPEAEKEPANPSLDPREASARLLPGARQSEIVVPASGALPLPALGLLSPLDPLPAAPPADRKFDGPSYTGTAVPDSAIAAGPAHLVCAVNRHLQIRTLAGTLLSTVSFAAFFGNDLARGGGDPRVAFDAGSGRFLFLIFAVRSAAPRASTCMLAVSATADPTGAWYKYVLDVGRGGPPPTEWADYPSLGYDGTAIYATFNMYAFDQPQYKGNRLVVIGKSQALSGQSLTAVRIIDNIALPSPPFPAGLVNSVLKPVEAVGPVSPALMIGTAGLAGIALYKIANPLGTNGDPVLTASFIDTTDFEIAGAAPQAGSAIPLYTFDARLEKTVYRDGVIWTAHTVSTTGVRGDRPQVNLYKLLPAGNGVLLDARSIVDPSRAYYYPAVVPDSLGDAIILLQGSDATSFASIYVARYVGATGQIEPPTLVEAGQSPYVFLDNVNRPRWGDYQDVSLDVTTGIHVWGQGMIPVTADLWQMRVARVPASPPVAPAGLTATAVSSSRVDLTWTDDSLGEAGFKIERKTRDGAFVPVATVDADVTRCSDTSASPGTSYTYRVRSFNGAGDSPPTPEAATTTPDRSVGVASLLLAPNPVTGGTTILGIVALDGPAAPGPVTVSLSSSNPAVASPTTGSVVFPQGAVSASFQVNSAAVSAPTSLSITAAANGTSKSATLDVRP